MRLSRTAQVVFLGILGCISYTLVDRFIAPTAPTFAATTDGIFVSDATINATHILIVSAFFLLPSSKHTLEEYKPWLSTFLTSVTTDVYFYTSPDMESMIKELRGDRPLTLDTSFSSPFDTPPLQGLEDMYANMRKQDPHKHRGHSVDYYAVWNSKPYLLNRAVETMRSKKEIFEYAFWDDAGSFRDDQLRVGAWPDVGRVEEIWREGVKTSGMAKEDLLFFPMRGLPHASMRHWMETLGPIESSFSQGTFFGGPPKAVAWLNQAFYAYHDYFLHRIRAFVGQDQRILNSLFVAFPNHVITVWLEDPTHTPAGLCGKQSLYYQFFFASEEDADKMNSIWTDRARSFFSWLHKPQECKRTRVLPMESVLKRRFGDEWNAPHTNIDINTSYRPT